MNYFGGHSRAVDSESIPGLNVPADYNPFSWCLHVFFILLFPHVIARIGSSPPLSELDTQLGLMYY